MRTVGQLFDVLAALHKANKEVEDWERAVENGGAPNTMKRKQEALESAIDWRNCLRNERLDGEE